MKRQQEVFRFKVLMLDGERFFYSVGKTLYFNTFGVRVKLASVPVSLFMSFLMRFDLLARLLRIGVHHLIYDGTGGYYCVYNKRCARFSEDGVLLGTPADLVGSRPLRVDVYQGSLIYGEYRSNPERSSVAVHAYDGLQHNKLFEVRGVRHIHSVKVQGERIYFSTGDYEEEAGIWYWDGKNIHRVLSGGQQRRAVDFLICDDGLYYGTDTPVEKNYIYKVTCDGQVKRLQAVSGSVFYMSEQAGRFWLATVVEPSVVNKSRTVELWSSCQRDKDKWVLVDTFTKDVWSMKYFQYGQIIFPYVYAKVSDRVWFYVQGVKGSGKSILKHMN